LLVLALDVRQDLTHRIFPPWLPGQAMPSSVTFWGKLHGDLAAVAPRLR
jgi:hypothetical protein